jgi:hypothetical protein
VHHDLMVDNKTGPWNRTRHRANENEVLVLDNRCGACSKLISDLLDLEKERPAILSEMVDQRVSTVESMLGLSKTRGSYGAGI